MNEIISAATPPTTSTSSCDSNSTTIRLPTNVLTNILKFVGVKTLCSAARASKAFREAADNDLLWKAHSDRRWRTKLNVPPPGVLYPFAIYHPSACHLLISDMRQILVNRGVDVSKFIEKSEYVQAIEASNPSNVAGWRATHASKWKASYVYAAHAALRLSITREELVNITWKMSFKREGGFEAISKFLPNGYYYSEPSFIADLKWEFIDAGFGDGKRPEHAGVRVGQYPELMIHRSADFGYELHNDYVVFRQQAPPEKQRQQQQQQGGDQGQPKTASGRGS